MTLVRAISGKAIGRQRQGKDSGVRLDQVFGLRSPQGSTRVPSTRLQFGQQLDFSLGRPLTTIRPKGTNNPSFSDRKRSPWRSLQERIGNIRTTTPIKPLRRDCNERAI